MNTQYTLPQSLPIIAQLITQSMIIDYSKVSNDFNPIHLDSTFAIEAGFDTTIAHGMMVLSYISEMMTLAFDTKWANTGQLKVKFRSPVLSGESIERIDPKPKIKKSRRSKEKNTSSKSENIRNPRVIKAKPAT